MVQPTNALRVDHVSFKRPLQLIPLKKNVRRFWAPIEVRFKQERTKQGDKCVPVSKLKVTFLLYTQDWRYSSLNFLYKMSIAKVFPCQTWLVGHDFYATWSTLYKAYFDAANFTMYPYLIIVSILFSKMYISSNNTDKKL